MVKILIQDSHFFLSMKINQFQFHSHLKMPLGDMNVLYNTFHLIRIRIPFIRIQIHPFELLVKGYRDCNYGTIFGIFSSIFLFSISKTTLCNHSNFITHFMQINFSYFAFYFRPKNSAFQIFGMNL